MFDKIIRYSINHKFVISALVIALIATGLFSLRNLPIDALPDITNNQVQILTTAPDLATQEVELFITYPIELAVKSIPRIVELRSISRFGLSIVTVVFEENADIYWARTQINERLLIAKEQIPEGFGSPELAPISTGLGEIFQYTISAEQGYEAQFPPSELRSVQDWVIVPQLLGTKGVAEVNTLGGILKEYEVAVNPNKLKSMNVTMSEIFEALSRNNENTGGAYIDKKPNAYFIRGVGMVNSLEDISKIVIKNNNNIPLLIRDVAEVQYGKSVRYGATTRNGNGEVVNGMVMMLKGSNSAEIVSLVKEKIEQIKLTLPEGVVIQPYLDRSKLVKRAIKTVRNNLIEGALIVIFILVLLIGNWRAGLIVASVIPLSLLFAFSMMRLFGVSGNLMSLGAIDFGLIVDGAVIVVEAIVLRLQTNLGSKKLTAVEMDKEVFIAASNIRNSAAFGEIIILIVYFPILALAGIEGKMFGPMAKTVSFAILGAFILSTTYVPMMSALFLKRKAQKNSSLSDKIIGFFRRIYAPILSLVLRFKLPVLILTVLLFTFAVFVFDRMGGEFIPTLEEGDIATHAIIPPGSSLEQEIQTTTNVEKLLLASFPEIEQVVSKIGSAEVPTDPMPMEVADVMVILKDKDEWVSASSKEEMFDKMEEVLNELPGVTTEFSQPIQMRFNELMTGVRSDVGIKIFGEDLDRLAALGDQAVELIQNIEGIENARAEVVSGLPQITVEYDKDKLALYGLNVQELNQTVRMGFAGSKAGIIYEGERKYDLVVRLAQEFRQDISNLRNLFISLPSGNQIPLAQVAVIEYQKGPALISRENGKRRIVVGFNVRGRDVQSVVDEIHDILDEDLTLPVGYFIQYAGQFENLQNATQRLALAVPVALLLILILLYFTFHSISQSLLIFTAIPMAAIGGVFSLWLRGMPFSISAGVGFIALFGVAVLNGIVLISYFNRLKKEGMHNIIERIKVGTSVRLRPVIMTAAVASFGFLPMALSTSSGAEVQKPLATVVIGGLITATFLTLIILPILYYYLERWTSRRMKRMGVSTIAVLLVIFAQPLISQNQVTFTLDQAISQALESNRDLMVGELDKLKWSQLREGAYQFPKTDINASLGQLNSKELDQSYSISQQFNPFLIKSKKQYAKARYQQSEVEQSENQQVVIFQIRKTWDLLQYHQALVELISEQEELWMRFTQFAKKRFEAGESNVLEQTTAETTYQSLTQRKKELQLQIGNYLKHLRLILNTSETIDIRFEPYLPKLLPVDIDTSWVNRNTMLKSKIQAIDLAKADFEVYHANKKPEFMAGYFLQSFKGIQDSNGEVISENATPKFHGINLGISIPLMGKGYSALQNVADTEISIRKQIADNTRFQLDNNYSILYDQYLTYLNNLDYFDQVALGNAALIESSATRSYESGEIGYIEYIQALHTKYEIDVSYLEAIHKYNRTINSILYLINQ